MQLTKTLVTLILAASVAVAAPAPCAECGDLVTRDAEAIEDFSASLPLEERDDDEDVATEDSFADDEDEDVLEARKVTGRDIYQNAIKMGTTTPYLAKGGNCKGPTNSTGGLTGKKGLDQSGFTLYAICHITKIKIPHSPKGQYLSPKGKKIPKAKRAKGDLVFFGKGTQCKGGPTHVGIVRDRSSILWYPRTVAGTRAKIEPMGEHMRGLSMCPKVVRFW